MHTILCKHARGSLEDYVETALEREISEIAFTDHIPLPGQFDQAHRMEPGELDTYVTWVEKVRRLYPEITIRLGIEADYYRGFERYTEEILQRYEFDVVIMSVHFLQHWPPENWVFDYHFPGKPRAEIYADYIDTLIEGIRSGLFDMIGHADLIKQPGDSLIRMIPEATGRLLDELYRAEMAMEINTSGYRKLAGETYPGPDWLPRLKTAKVAITTGSDAHAPEQVGLQFPAVYRALRREGFDSLAGFEKRRQIRIRLDT